MVSLLGLGGSKIPHTSIMHFRWDSHNHVLDQIVTKNHVCGFGKKIQLCLDKCDDANEKNLCDVGHVYRLMPLAFLPYPPLSLPPMLWDSFILVSTSRHFDYLVLSIEIS